MDSESGRRIDLIVLGFSACVFFVFTSILVLGVPKIYNSPDENANATFAETVRTTDQLLIAETDNLLVGGLIHPRSVVAVADILAPGSFLGLPFFYGLLSKLTGASLIRLLTPVLVIAALFAWRSIIEHIFCSRRVALIATLAIMFHPGLWYYASRTMMHNAPFVALLIISAYLLIIRKTDRDAIFSGAALGLALWFRTIEVIWIAPIVLGLLIAYRRTLRLERIGLFAAAMVLTLLPMPGLNEALYGQPWLTGYTAHQAASAISTTSQIIAPIQGPLATVFSLDVRSVLRNAWHYFIFLFPWMSLTAALGFLFLLRTRRVRVYLIVAILVTIWLWLFYGSWNFHDNPDPSIITIGNSYVRYWLPIFVLASPFVAVLIDWLARRFSALMARHIAIGLTVLMIAANVYPTFFANDGLWSTRQNIFAFAATRDIVLDSTEENAIIVVDRADKFLWPERRVIQPLRSESTYQAMPALAAIAPLYYFGITFPQTDIAYLNTIKLAEMKMRIEYILTIGEESLYRFSFVE